MLTVLLPLAAKLGMWLLEMVMDNSKENKAARSLHAALAVNLRESGMKDVRSRFEAEQQIEANEDEWNRREEVKRQALADIAAREHGGSDTPPGKL